MDRRDYAPLPSCGTVLCVWILCLLATAHGGAPDNLRLLYNNLGPQQTKDAIDLWLERASRGGFNAVTYPIGVFRRDYAPTKRPLPGFDPITYFVEQAHARKMIVFAWWAAFYNEKLAKERGFTTPVNAEGKTPNLYYGYCPNDPKYREVIKQFLEEFLSAYDFDGISYDDGYGFPPGDTCYCPVCLAKFKAKFHGNPLFIRKGPRKFTREELAEYRKLRSSWRQFRLDSVCDFAKFVQNTARRVKPKIIVSTSGSARPDQNRFYDKVRCLNEGLIDFYEPELYFSSGDPPKRMRDALAKWRKAVGPDAAHKVVPIIYAWMRRTVRGEQVSLPKTGDELLAEAKALSDFGPNLAFFDDRGLTDEIMATLATGTPPGREVPAYLRRTPGKFNILITGFINDDHYKALLDLFRGRGAVVKFYIGSFTPELLANFDLYCDLPTRPYTDEEAAALRAFIERGGRALIMGGDYQNKCVGANVLLKSFGLSFTRGCGSPVFTKAIEHPLTKGIFKVHCLGGTGIHVQKPSVALLKAEEVIGLAAYEGEKGRLLVLCDEWPIASFGKDTENIRSEQYDHRKLAENVVRWLME